MLRSARERSGARTANAFLDEVMREGLVGADREEQVLAAVIWLGPNLDPGSFLDPLVAAATARTAARGESPVNVAVALGSGWGRELRRDLSPSWDGPWERAIFAIADDFQRSLQFTASLLVRLVPRVHIDRREQRSFAELFALEFTLGCRCGRHRRICGDPSDHGCCISQHSIAAWDPSVAHLSAYVDQAVRGLAGNTIRGAAFADGLLFAELRRAQRVRRVNVEGYECSECLTISEIPACANTRCPGPTSWARCRRLVLSNRIVAPVDSGGDYDMGRRRVCGDPACRSLYLLRDDPSCPRCQWCPQPGARPASRQVWTRRHTVHVDLAEVAR